ncbi:MAG: zinc ribbon domain-containing protein [Candidatus Pacearchaeota archaeon]|nr:zinc ribbon domain-containing protein [Candidatus Pacearchaeota archaeon]
MFKKKINCLYCGKKVSKNFSFCPFCGGKLEEKKEPDSLLDELDFIEKQMRIPFFLKFPIKRMVKQLAKEFSEIEKEVEQEKPKVFAHGFSINITSTPDGKPIIKVRRLTPAGIKVEKQKPELQILNDFSKKDAEKFAKLKKIEPETKVRRLADKIVYELKIPGVKKEKVIINHLGNTIEVKALAKNKAYFKAIPVSLAIKNWYIEKDNLVLELET